MKKKKKLVLILSGGGAKAAFQVGAWRFIQDKGVSLSGDHQSVDTPHAVFGVSGGGLNGVMMAMGKHQELFDLWNGIAGHPSEVYQSDFVQQQGSALKLNIEQIKKFLFSELSLFDQLGFLFKRSRKRSIQKVISKFKTLKGLADYSPLIQKLRELVSIEAVKSEVFRAGFVSLTDGKYYAPLHSHYLSDLDFQNGVMASAGIPIFWPPIERIRTKNFELTSLVDGGLINATPFEDAIQFINGSEAADYHFLVISCHTARLEKMEEDMHLLSIAKRSLGDLISSEMRANDMNGFLHINKLVKQAEKKGIALLSSSGRKLRAFKIKIIRPKRELGFALDFSRASVMDSFSQGFQLAKKVLQSPDWE